MKRILINATQNEEIRVALCKGNHLYDFDLENRTREQKKSNIYKGHVTRVEPSLEAVFVEYGSQRQGFLPIREISAEYLNGNPRDENIKKLIKEGDELIVQVEKEERGNKGAALSTYVSLAGRYLVLMPNNPRGGGISRQISGKLREDMKRMLSNLDLPKGMSVIIRTAGIGKTQEDLQHDLNHLLNIWQAIQEQNQKYPSPRLVHQEAGVVTRAVRDYLRDDITEIWIDNENAYIEAAGFIDAVMPKQAEKLRKYTDYEPMFSRFNIEKQIETAYQREVRLPSGGSIVIDQTEALVSIDINSAKSTKGSDVAETAFHTNLEAADEIARQLRLRDMGGLIVIDFIDMNDNKNQKEVEKRLIDATKYDRARVQFGDISKFGLMEMSRQRLRPSLEESTGYICPRCHGNGMIRDLRSLSLSIMRQIEQIALKERQGEVQAEVPTDIAAFLLNEKRDSLVYLEQDSGTRITILPHAHLESPNFKLHFNRDGFAPSSYERITDTQQQEHSDLGYDVDWQTADSVRPEQQPTRQPRTASENGRQQSNTVNHSNERRNQNQRKNDSANTNVNQSRHSSDHSGSATASSHSATSTSTQAGAQVSAVQPQAVAWLSNLFAQAPQAQTTPQVSSRDAAQAIEALVNTGAQSLGSFGQVDSSALAQTQNDASQAQTSSTSSISASRRSDNKSDDDKEGKQDDRRRRKSRKSRPAKSHQRKEAREDTSNRDKNGADKQDKAADVKADNEHSDRHNNSNRSRHNDDKNTNAQHQNNRANSDNRDKNDNRGKDQDDNSSNEQTRSKRKPHSQRSSRGNLERSETLTASDTDKRESSAKSDQRNQDPNEVTLQVNEAPVRLKEPEVVHLSLDDSKSQPSQANANANVNAPTTEHEQTSTTSSSADKSEAVEAKGERTDDESTVSATAPVSTNPDDKQSPSSENQAAKGTKTAPTPTSTDSSGTGVKADKDSGTGVKADKDKDKDKNSLKIDNSVSSDKNTDSLAFDRKDLFAERYVTANKFGQASNDPRVVRQQQPASAPQAGAASAIHGSVGDFIRNILPKAEHRLTDDGIITCFIEAVAVHQQRSTEGASESDTGTRFDFSNYGYKALAADYLTRFATMTQAASQFAAAQGKTSVAPRAIGKRASNDPRGQHPDYEASVQQVSKQDAADSQATVDHDNPSLITDSEVQAHQVEANALAAETQTDDISTESETLLEVDQELTAQKQADASAPTADTSNSAVDSDVPADTVDDVAEASKDDAQASKSKTTIASYKNMIENVAEQLLPQTGMFNLTTPKVPKARSRKPKTEHKKPTQAEKAQADKDSQDHTD